jgi:hypothetical protein
MVDKKDKELSEKDLKKATGGAADGRRPVIKGGHTNRPVADPDPDADNPESPSTTTPRTRPGTKINPV